MVHVHVMYSCVNVDDAEGAYRLSAICLQFAAISQSVELGFCRDKKKIVQFKSRSC